MHCAMLKIVNMYHHCLDKSQNLTFEKMNLNNFFLVKRVALCVFFYLGRLFVFGNFYTANLYFVRVIFYITFDNNGVKSATILNYFFMLGIFMLYL